MYPANNPSTLRSDIADAGAAPSGRNHLTRYFEVWKHLPPPLRPARTVVELVERHIEDRDAPAFLMGVTPELSAVTTDLTAMDYTPQMIRHIWPGDTAHRRALLGNWLDTKLPNASFRYGVGDGSFNMLDYPGDFDALWCELTRILRRRGRILCRVYLTPDRPGTMAQLRKAVMKGEIAGFPAFKWRLEMIMARESGNPNVVKDDLYRMFIAQFPDRDELVRRTGWRREEIDTIDYYKGSAKAANFPTRAQLQATMPRSFAAVRFVPTTGYELCECCPMLVIDM